MSRKGCADHLLFRSANKQHRGAEKIFALRHPLVDQTAKSPYQFRHPMRSLGLKALRDKEFHPLLAVLFQTVQLDGGPFRFAD
jgi:hypothetical protein